MTGWEHGQQVPVARAPRGGQDGDQSVNQQISMPELLKCRNTWVLC